jgi:hypothetical protein
VFISCSGDSGVQLDGPGVWFEVEMEGDLGGAWQGPEGVCNCPPQPSIPLLALRTLAGPREGQHTVSGPLEPGQVLVTRSPVLGFSGLPALVPLLQPL